MRGPDHRSVPTTFSVGCVLRITFWAALFSVAFGSEVGSCIAGAQEKQPARVESLLDRLDPSRSSAPSGGGTVGAYGALPQIPWADGSLPAAWTRSSASGMSRHCRK